MKAMILAAGLGTRLAPLTTLTPKPLVPVGNRPIIDRTISWLKAHGVDEIIINTHHHRDQVRHYLDQNHSSGMRIHISEEPEILGTGGGIRKTRWFWNREPFIVVNGDILTDIDLSSAYSAHLKNGGLATLVLHDVARFNQIKMNHFNGILDISPVPQPGRLAFTGIHILRPEVLDHIPAGRASCIVDTYRSFIRDGLPLKGHVVQGHYWRDAGTVESYIQANREALSGTSFLLGRHCLVHDDVRLTDWAVLGDNTIVEKGAEITRSIIWENITVKKGVRIIDSVVSTPGEVATDRLEIIG